MFKKKRYLSTLVSYNAVTMRYALDDGDKPNLITGPVMYKNISWVNPEFNTCDRYFEAENIRISYIRFEGCRFILRKEWKSNGKVKRDRICSVSFNDWQS